MNTQPMTDEQKIALRKNTQQQLNYLNEREADLRAFAADMWDGLEDAVRMCWAGELQSIEKERKALTEQFKATFR